MKDLSKNLEGYDKSLIINQDYYLKLIKLVIYVYLFGIIH